ncbi:MAG TPA: Ig-like domain-containing protein, partial [Gemmatimonadaceae bacterium]|nr:Ig-like domain-containing protein [Gemmatimonadaceae bacterium]
PGAWWLAALVGACASPGTVPGGHIDKNPLVLVQVTPDTGALNVQPREVVFRFDKVVNERPLGAQSLDQLVVVSPAEGIVNVDWRRQAIAIRPRKGWRPHTTYSVTLLPGLTDLQNNVLRNPLHLEFSTGPVIARGAVRGVAFDWAAQQVVRGARVEATTGSDTSFRYIAAADSAGRFALTNLPPGIWFVRAYKDENTNRTLDAREQWDSATVTVSDSARHDFYVFAHDSIAPIVSNVTVSDSVTVRVQFNKPLSPATPLDTSNFVVTRKSDSSRVAIRLALPAAAFDSLAARLTRVRQDSIARADTSAAARRERVRADSARRATLADSISSAQQALLRAARDTVRRDSLPKPTRPAPISTYVLQLRTPLVPLVPMQLEVRDITSLTGATRTYVRGFVMPKPPPLKKDSTATKVPSRKDSAAAKVPAKRDSAATAPPKRP